MLRRSRYVVFSPAFSTAAVAVPERILYSTSSCALLRVPETVVACLDTAPTTLPADWQALLLQAGILVHEQDDEFNSVRRENEKAAASSPVLKIVIQPTSMCQLACNYCGQQHRPERMDADNQERLLVFARSRLASGKYTTLSVSWFGGEPLLALPIIRALTPQLAALAKQHSAVYVAQVTTNGVALAPLVYRELQDALHVNAIEVTLDGPRTAHDSTRVFKGTSGPSFDAIVANLSGIAAQSSRTAALSLRCNITKNNSDTIPALLTHLAERHLASLFSHVYMAPVHDWENEAGSAALDPEQFSRWETGILANALALGFSVQLIPTRAPIVCMSVDEGAYLISASGHIYNCTEVSLTDRDLSPVRPGSGRLRDYLGMVGALSQPTSTAKIDVASLFHDHMVGPQPSVPCQGCHVLPVCGGACPKAWSEGRIPCPSYRFNLPERLLLYLAARQGLPSRPPNSMSQALSQPLVPQPPSSQDARRCPSGLG